MKHLISPQTLLSYMNDPEKDLVILDARFDLMNVDYGKEAYAKGHIPGALLVDVEHDLSRPKDGTDGNHPFQTPERLKEIFEAFGISNDTTVVVYDEGDFNGPTRLLYQALQLGLENFYVLDGAIQGYEAAGGTLSTTPHTAAKRGQLTINYKPDMVVDMAYVKACLYDPNTVLIDSRALIRYKGDEEPIYPIAGHIPSAKNYHCAAVLDNGTLRDEDWLRTHFSDLDPSKNIILSCGSGISACVNSLALMQLDIPHTLYNGSYSEWISHPENEVKTGVE